MSQSGIFKSRKALLIDYTPPRLPHREKQMEELTSQFSPVLHEHMSVKLHLTGDVGTGKTVLSRRFGKLMVEEGSKLKRKFRYVHINMAYMPRPYHVAAAIVNEVAPPTYRQRTGLSPEEMLLAVSRTLEEEYSHLIICLDEVGT